MSGARPRWYLGSVGLAAALGFSLRVAWSAERCLATGFKFGFDEYLYYVSTAMNAFAGRGFFPEYNHVGDGIYVPPPLQSLFVLAVYAVAGRVVDAFWVMVVQSLFAALAIVFSAEIGRTLVSAGAGVFAGLCVALFPPFVYWSGLLTTESNYLALLSLAVLLLCRFTQSGSLRTAVGAALVLGLLDLQRVNALYLGPLLALFVLVKLRPRAGRWLPALVLAVVPLVVVAPWLARNLSVYGEPIWVNSNGGINFHFGNRLNLDPEATPYWEQMNGDHGPTGPFVAELEDRLREPGGRLKVTYHGYSEAYLAQARSYILAHPLHFARNWAVKFANQFLLVQDPGPDEGLFRHGLNWALHWIVLCGGLVGLALLASRRSPGVAVLALVFGYFAFIGGFFPLAADGRWNLFLKWMLILFLAGGASLIAQAGWGRLTGRRR